MDIRAVENPFPIADREENIASFFDCLQRFAIRPATNSLGCKETGAFAVLVLDKIARFLEPVTTKIRLRLDTIAVVRKNCIDIVVAEFATQQFSAEERWITHDHIAAWPFAFCVKLQSVIRR